MTLIYLIIEVICVGGRFYKKTASIFEAVFTFIE